MSELEQQITALQHQLHPGGSAPSIKPVTAKSRVGAVVLILIFTLVFGVAMYVSILLGPADGKASVVALVGAVGVAVSVVCANSLMLMNEWENANKRTVDSVLTMCSIGTGAIGSMLVIFGLF